MLEKDPQASDASSEELYLAQWLHVANLLRTYGQLLPERMHAMLLAYYEEDMSLSEIGQQNGVSRQAVHDHLKRGIEHLERFESTLGLLKKQAVLRQLNETLHHFIEADGQKRDAQNLYHTLVQVTQTLDEYLQEGSS